MGILDIFKGKKQASESNSMFGQTALGNNIVYQGDNKNPTVNTQILYVTTASTTNAGRPVDMSMLARNSTISERDHLEPAAGLCGDQPVQAHRRRPAA